MKNVKWMPVWAVSFAVAASVHAWTGAGTDWVLAAGFSGVIAAILSVSDE